MHFRIAINDKYFVLRFYVTRKHSAAPLGDEKPGNRFPRVYDTLLGIKRGRKCCRLDQAQT